MFVFSDLWRDQLDGTEEEIVENGLIAFSVLFFSVEVMADIILKEV